MKFSRGAVARINGDYTVAENATVTQNGTITLTGNLTNNGTQVATEGGWIFIGDAISLISGSGSTQFYRVFVNKSNKTDEVQLNLVPSGSNGFLVLLNGTFHINGTSVYSHPIFVLSSGRIEIPGTAGFWLENENVIITSSNADMLLAGLLKIDAGILNIGSEVGHALRYNGDATTTGELQIAGGELNIAGGLFANESGKNLDFMQTGGELNIATAGELTSEVFALAENDKMTATGGEIVLKNTSSVYAEYYVAVTDENANISAGHTLKIDAATTSANATFDINTTAAVGNLLMTGTNNPIVKIGGRDLTAMGDVTVAGSGIGLFNQNGFDVKVGGNWNHNIATNSGLAQSNKSIVFFGSGAQAINTTVPDLKPEFSRLMLDKDAGTVVLNADISITSSLRLIGGAGKHSLLDLNDNNITLLPAANVYAAIEETGANTFLSLFDNTHFITNTGISLDTTKGRLVKMIASDDNVTNLDKIYMFPVGGGEIYSPLQLTLKANRFSFTPSQARNISIKVVPQEHPSVEVTGRALQRYWNIGSNNIAMSPGGGTVQIWYGSTIASGSEGYYHVLLFAPSYNNPDGYWHIDPGVNSDVVDFNLKTFYSQENNCINGDWTAGEPSVASAVYYSRKDGYYDDPNTWSKINYGGAASQTIPNKRSDKVKIRGHKVTIRKTNELGNPVTAPSPASLIAVESAADIYSASGQLFIEDELVVTGDTFRLQSGATLGIGSASGITTYPTEFGNVQTTVRIFAEGANYTYTGNVSPQLVGNALPINVGKFSVEKDANTILHLGKNVTVSTGLYIEDGVLDLGAYEINGYTQGRTLTMNGGELIIRSASFPQNYAPPTFTAGRVTFSGDGNLTIPSSQSSPIAVLQYNDLKIESMARSGNITFAAGGEIVINGDLDISQMNFANNTYSFFTDGSTVKFAGNENQVISFLPQSPSDASCYLKYYNLDIAGNGNKTIAANLVNADLTILNDLTIQGVATFVANGVDIDLYGNWTNNGGIFHGTTGEKVNFISEVPALAIDIKSDNIANNTFADINISGAGIVNLLDDIKINGNINIASGVTLRANSAAIELGGNWVNNGGTFEYGNSEVKFVNTDAAANQAISKTSGNEEFYNLTLANGNNSVNAFGIGASTDGMIIHNELNLSGGTLRLRDASEYRFVEVNGEVNLTSGFVEGELRKNIAAGVMEEIYEVGCGNYYNPVTLKFNGTGGTTGMLGVMADEITATSSPIASNGIMITPANCPLDPLGNVAMQYVISKPENSTFTLGEDRNYNVRLVYTQNQVRNSSNPSVYNIAVYSGGAWIAPFSYNESAPVMRERGNYYAEIAGLKDLGAAILGPPGMMTYYTRENGAWNVAANWSNQMYGGTAATSYPTGTFRAFIGNGNTITLEENVVVTGEVIIDTLGTLKTNNHNLTGTGTFSMLAGATLDVTDANGITTSGTTGNIQTTTRNYNFENHNKSSFIYSGSVAQNTGNGLPTEFAALTINKSAADQTVTINAGHDISITDSLYILKGNLNAGSSDDIYMYGNINQTTDGTFIPAARKVFLRGESPVLLTSGSDAKTLDFYDLEIYKEYLSGNIILEQNTNLNIAHNLKFADGNKAIIDATKYSTPTNTLYVGFGENATAVVGAGYISTDYSGGWIYGEVQKYAAIGETDLTFETGTDTYYSPYGLRLAANAGANGTAGVIAARAIAGDHPQLATIPATTYPINPERNLSVYWRLTKPAGSAFERGERSADYTVRFKIPEQQVKLDCFACADLAFYRGGTGAGSWQGMEHNTVYGNAGTMDTCTDTRSTSNGFPRFTFEGDSCSVPSQMAYIKVPGVAATYAFGAETLDDGSMRLGDFVAGDRNNAILQYYTFYSINDGDWSDPNTWSTVSYESTENAAVAQYEAGTDPYIRPFPARRYDNVYIGNGKKVTLDIDVGSNEYSPTAMFGPSCVVENTGILDFGTQVFRGNQFQARAGSTLIIGSNDGINKSNTDNFKGNVQLSYYSIAPVFSDSIKVIYKPTGITSNGMSRRLIDRNSLNYYIKKVSVKQNGTEIFSNQTDNRYLSGSYGNLRTTKKITLEAGETYTIEITPSTNGGWRYYNAWIDYGFNNNGWVELVSSDVRSNSNNTVEVATFTVPASIPQGSTTIRFGISNESLKNDTRINGQIDTVTLSQVTRSGVGEYEDYTVFIKRNNFKAEQTPGTGLPDVVKSLEVMSENLGSSNSTFTLDKDITVIDEVKVTSGTFIHAKQANLNLYGNFVVDTLDGYNADIYSENEYKLYKPYNVLGGVLNLIGSQDQNLSGQQAITLNKLNINKTGGNVLAKTDLAIGNDITFTSNTKLIPDDDVEITIGGFVVPKTPDGVDFSASRMIAMPGDSLTTAVVSKDMIAKKSDYTNASGIPYYTANRINATGNVPRIKLVTLRRRNNNNPGSVIYKFLANKNAPNNTYQNPENTSTGFQDFTDLENPNIPGDTPETHFPIGPGDYYLELTINGVNGGTTYVYGFCYIDNNWDDFGISDMVGENNLNVMGPGGADGSVPNNSILRIPFTISDTLYNGPVRMRVKTAHNSKRPEPRHNETYLDGIYRRPTGGEIEDYILNITGCRDLPVQDPNSKNALVLDTVYIADTVVTAVDPTFDMVTTNTINTNNYHINSVTYNDVVYNINYNGMGRWNNPNTKLYKFPDTLTVVAGSSNLFEFRLHQSSSYYCMAWADFVHKGYFLNNYDDRMIVGRYNRLNSQTNNITMNIAIPDTAFNGITRMRVKLQQGTGFDNYMYRPNNFPHNNSKSGQIMDFNVRVIGGRDPYSQTYLENNTIDPDKIYSYEVKKRMRVDSYEVAPKVDEVKFPIGTGDDYNPAEFTLKQKTLDPNNAKLSVKLVKGKHSNRLDENILNKYWQVSTTGITIPDKNEITDAENKPVYKFYYDAKDINGNISEYKPGRYIKGVEPQKGSWEIDLGENPTSTSSQITITNENGINGDWTAGYPEAFFKGRIFYSIKNGNWNDKTSWSTHADLKHTGPPSSYFPGQLYSADTVNLDGHKIVYSDSLHVILDSLRIGGTNDIASIGELTFGTTKPELNAGDINKSIEMRSLFLDDDGGKVYSEGTNINDTLMIHKLLRNESTAGGMDLASSNNRINLKFGGDMNTYINGEGTWSSIADVIVNKTRGLTDTLLINSATFLTKTNDNAQPFVFRPLSGIITNNRVGTDLYLGSADQDVDMQVNSGINVERGRTLTRGNLSTNTYSTIIIKHKTDDNDNNIVELIVGDGPNENLYYRTGSQIDVEDGNLKIAAALARKQSNSTVKLNIEEKGEIAVNTVGNNQTNVIGFDISNSASEFSMSGGRIVIASANANSDADFRLNALDGNGMTGGTIQSGDTALTAANTKIKIGGKTPLYNVHFANDPAHEVQTDIAEQTVTIKNNWTIDAGHKFDLNGNTVNLGGNLTNFGDFRGYPTATTTNPWKIVLNGSGTQTIFNQTGSALSLYNLTLNKPTGRVVLSDEGNSSLIIKNTLEFSTNNNSVICMKGDDSRYVMLLPDAYSNASQILRNGNGHIAGLLYRRIEDNTASNLFSVGSADLVAGNENNVNNTDASLYRPVTLKLSDEGNTVGLIRVRFNDELHPQADDYIEPNRRLLKYWTVRPAETDGFTLGSEKQFELTLQFLASDIVSGANGLSMEQLVYNPALETLPEGTQGNWTALETPERTNTVSRSIQNSHWGDFTLGELSGTAYYSVADGDWNNPGTWSKASYRGTPETSDWPNSTTDKVYIGDGKKVTLPENLHPNVRSVVVEKYDENPGYLQINGSLGYLTGTSFTLNDDCTLGIQHINGIAQADETSTGAITTQTRIYGVSRYIYNLEATNGNGSQVTGKGLPNTVKTLILDNPSTNAHKLFLYRDDDNTPLTVNDTLKINQGILNTSSRNVTIKNVLVVDSVANSNDGTIEPTTSRFVFTSGSNGNCNYLRIANRKGIQLYDAELRNSVEAFIPDENYPVSDRAGVYVANNLRFAGDESGEVHFVLGKDTRLTVQNSADDAIEGYENKKFILTSRNSGMLIRKVDPGNNYIFPVGSSEDGTNYYAPAEFLTANFGTSGFIGLRTSWGSNTGEFAGGHIGLMSSVPNPQYFKRYWTVDSVSAQIGGQFKFYYNDVDLANSTSTEQIDRIARWNPTFERTPGAWEAIGENITLNTTEHSVVTPIGLTYEELTGDWIMANHSLFRRIFYSLKDGYWNSDQSWTFNNTHSGNIAGTGLFPNAAQDSVVIGGQDAITLNIDKPFTINTGVGIQLGTSAENYGTLKISGSNVLNGDIFVMNENSTLQIGSPDGINTIATDAGSIQTKYIRQFDIGGNYVYDGSENQVIGEALPTTVKNLTIANIGTEGSNTVLFDRTINVSGDFSIQSGKADLQANTISAIGLTSKVAIADDAYLRIGGSNNMDDALADFKDFSGVTAGSYIEFYGDGQDPSIVSDLFYNYSNKTGIGYGNLMVSNGQNQSISRRILVRGNLYTRVLDVLTPTKLTIDAVNSLEVRGSILNNNAEIYNNEGVIEIGE